MRRAWIIGDGGQDGVLLYNRLVAIGGTLLGWGRQKNRSFGWNGDPSGSLEEPESIDRLMREFAPTEIYYLAAFHHSSGDPALSNDSELWERSELVHVDGWRRVLESARRYQPKCHLFYAASSLVFGREAPAPQNEETPFRPECIYGITKTTGIHLGRFYRRQYGLLVSSGILYTHESPLRRGGFVAPRIIRELQEVKEGRRKKLVLGSLNARVDWGDARDFVEAMLQITGESVGDDYIVATGGSHSVLEFASIVCERFGLDLKSCVREDPLQLLRAPRGDLVGDASKLRERVGWKPLINFREMVEYLIRENEREGRVE